MVYQTADPPLPHTQETLWQMNGEIMSMRRLRPRTRGRVGMSHVEEARGHMDELDRLGWTFCEDKAHLPLILTS